MFLLSYPSLCKHHTPILSLLLMYHFSTIFSISSTPFYHSSPSPIIFPSLLIFFILSPLLRWFLLFLIFFLLEHKYENAGTGVKNWDFIREVSPSIPVLSDTFLYFLRFLHTNAKFSTLQAMSVHYPW
jgi:hypothetical protein